MTRNKGKGTKLKVFSGREASLNRAIFQTLDNMSPEAMWSIFKQITQ